MIATAYYTATSDSVLIINPTGSSYSGVTLQINNAGLTPSQSTLYTMACPLGHTVDGFDGVVVGVAQQVGR